MLGDPGEHFRPYFFVVVERPGVGVRKARMFQLDIGTALRDHVPADLKQGFQYTICFRARPDTQAIAREKLIDVGGSSLQLSTSSATVRRAIA